MRSRRERVSAVIKVHDRRLLVATHNPGKVAEYDDILRAAGIEYLTLDEVGIADDVPETGNTFRENAILKAVAYAKQSGLLTLADDSGLEVDALGGKPGVLTARYGGPGLTAADRYQLLLRNLAGVPASERTARFHCVVALAGPDGALLGTTDGVIEGEIAREPNGQGGFGYDPVFYLSDYGLTMAQLPADEKHRISHRGRAALSISPLLNQFLLDLS
jgi:XTP/dITP diphosphohydrolase